MERATLLDHAAAAIGPQIVVTLSHPQAPVLLFGRIRLHQLGSRFVEPPLARRAPRWQLEKFAPRELGLRSVEWDWEPEVAHPG